MSFQVSQPVTGDSSSLHWVLGVGGLLGASICRDLTLKKKRLFTPTQKITWSNPSLFREEMECLINHFSVQIAAGVDWYIYWAAGIGAMGSSKDELAMEALIISTFLRLIGSNALLAKGQGRLMFASSAGAIYAGSTDRVINERSDPAPNTPYAYAKLQHEEMFLHFHQAHQNIGLLIARISTLYGPGQSFGKQQGLIAMVARKMLRNQVINIYVPLDTTRDFIEVSDAAHSIVKVLSNMGEAHDRSIQIIANGQSNSIAQVLQIFHRVTGIKPRYFSSTNSNSILYGKHIVLQTAYEGGAKAIKKTSLAIGVARVFEHERRVFSCASNAVDRLQ